MGTQPKKTKHSENFLLCQIRVTDLGDGYFPHQNRNALFQNPPPPPMPKTINDPVSDSVEFFVANYFGKKNLRISLRSLA